MSEELTEISKKLDKIEGKLSEKWQLPVALAVLGFILTLANFFIIRWATDGDAKRNKAHEIFIETAVLERITFYKNCKIRMNYIDEQFESYCRLGVNRQVGHSIDTALISFRKLRNEQQYVEKGLIETLESYTDYVAGVMFEAESNKPAESELSIFYQNSTHLLMETTNILDKAIKKLEE